jgi:hypothetical protein
MSAMGSKADISDAQSDVSVVPIGAIEGVTARVVQEPRAHFSQ